MKKLISSIFLLLIFGLIACQKHSHVLPLLQEAETLMPGHPDSSLILLESVRFPEKLSEEDYATWCLLVTQARDKNYVKHTSDSVINVAVRFFEKQKDPLQYAKSLYYKGRVFQDQKKIEEAAELFVKAFDVGKDCLDYNLLFLISSRLGTLYGKQDLAKEALTVYQKSYQYAIQSGDSSCLSFAYSYLGRAYGLSEEWEQSLSYYEKALSIATRIKDSQATNLAMNEYVAVCVNADRSDKITNYEDLLLETDEDEYNRTGNLEQFYLTAGDMYRHIEKYDEAILYLNKTLQSENLYTLAGGCQCLYLLYEEMKQYEKAVHYNNMNRMYTDSIQKLESRKAIMEIKSKYDYEKMQKENLQLKLNILYVVGGSLIGLFAISWAAFVKMKKNRRRMKDKIQLISDLKAQQETLLQKLDVNVQKQKKNLSEITFLSDQLETSQQGLRELQNAMALLKGGEGLKKDVDDLSRQLEMKSVSICEMEKCRSMLIDENKKLEKKNLDFEQTIRLLRENICKLNIDKAQETLNAVSFALIIKMRKEKAPLQDNEWAELFLIVNLLHKNLIDRLSTSFPQLNHEDLKLCCLVKLMFTNEEISSILAVQEDALAKRKRRLSTKFGKEKWDKGGLGAYIDTF
ncbi:tetratricopeptide repeat protein [Parabacteroides sp.]